MTNAKRKFRVERDLNRALLSVAIATLTAIAGCDDEPPDDGVTRVEGNFEHLYAGASVTWTDDGENTLGYLHLLPNLDAKKVDLDDAIEMPGWPGVHAQHGKLFVSDGEKPTMSRYRVDEKGTFIKEKSLSFRKYGAEFAGAGIVSDDKVYMFTDEGVVWDPDTMQVTGTIELPEIEDRDGGMEYGGISIGRPFAVHGNRAYVATSWANWDTYDVSEDGLIVVIDTDKDEVIETIPAPCPYLDVATVDDDGYVYFSNWTYSVSQTLLRGKKKACAVRIAPGKTELDADWSLTFADVTGGHEGAALRYAGDGKAVFVAYDEGRIEGGLSNYEEEGAGDLADKTNWKMWMVDLETLEAEPVDGLDYSSGGYYLARVDEGAFVLAPDDEYTATSFYALDSDATAERRFEVEGWVLDLVQVR